MNKKCNEKSQFEELHIVEKKPGGEEQIKVITEQKLVEWEVRKFYWKLYQDKEKIINKEEILKNIASINENFLKTTECGWMGKFRRKKWELL